MRIVQFTEPRLIAIVERPDPMPGPGEVVVRITAAGICGTDLHLFEGSFGSFPLTPGHDAAGVIEFVGEGVPASRRGQRVTLDPAGCCARAAVIGELCPACRRGATQLCRQGSYLGISEPGCLAELVRIPAARAVPLPEALDDAAATVLEPVAVGLHLLEQIADRPGDALVLGAGSIGIIAALLLQEAGRRVVVAEPLASRRALATRMGVRTAIALEALTGPWEGPLVIETSGHPSAAELLRKTVPPGATVVLIGGDTTIPGYVILTRELEVRAVKGGRGLYPEAVRIVSAGRISPARLISHRFPVREVHHAFETACRRDVVTRALLDMTTW